jgi:hypothetical protein
MNQLHDIEEGKKEEALLDRKRPILGTLILTKSTNSHVSTLVIQ